MKVYLLFEHWEYEGSEVVGVFASPEAAEKEADKRNDPEGYSFRRQSFYVKAFDVQEGGV